MTQAYSALKSQRNSTSSRKVSRQLFPQAAQIIQQRQNRKLTEQDQDHYNIGVNTETSRQFCKAYQKQNTQNSHQKSRMKNEQSSDYIRNLYKKYLGKQNNNQTHSQRKLRTDVKQNKKTLITETYRQSDLSHTSNRKQKISSILQENKKNQNEKSNFLKRSQEKKEVQSKIRQNIEIIPTQTMEQKKPFYTKESNKSIQLMKNRQNKKCWYNTFLYDDFALNMLESQGSSILIALKNIRKYKQKNT